MCIVASSRRTWAVENTVFRYRALPSPDSIQSIKLAFISLDNEGTFYTVAQKGKKENPMDEKSRIWCGIDVSKNDMAVALDLSPSLAIRKLPVKKFRRTLDGLHDMLAWCEANKAHDIHVLMEATGVYSRELQQWLQLHFPAIPVTVANPRIVKHFIESQHLGNKTDELDAMAIARMGSVQKPEATPLPAPEYLQLQELIRSRNDLVVKKESLEVSRAAMQDENSIASKAMLTVIKVMEKSIAEISQAIFDLKARIPEIRKNVDLMCTMPGIGTISACTILAELGPFSPDYARNEFSGYTGLQPVQRQSGTSVKGSHLSKNGSPLLRKVLYLCSMHAVAKIPALHSLHARLLAKGKKPLTARCACMRRMLLILRSMVLNNTEFRADYVSAREMTKKSDKAS